MEAFTHNLSFIIDRVISYLSAQVVFSAILFAIVILLAFMLKNKSRFLLVGLWSFIFLRLVLPANWAHEYSGRMLLQRLSSTLSIQSSENQPRIQTAPAVRLPLDKEAQHINRISFVHHFIFLLWLGGVFILSGLYIYKLRQYRRQILAAKVCSDEKIVELLRKWQQEFRVKRQVCLVRSTFHSTPFTMGLVRPVIVLPNSFFRQQDFSTIEAIIAHEMTHIKHADDLWLRLQTVIQIIYFFDPIVWIAGWQLLQTREQLCDAMVVSKQKLSKKAYGNGLLNVIQHNRIRNRMFVFFPAFWHQRERLGQRIENIKNTSALKQSNFLFATLFLLIVGFMLLPMGQGSFSHALTNAKSLGFLSPVPNGTLVLEFGKDWNKKLQQYYLHEGIDILGSPQQTDIVAAADGQVISSGQDDIFSEFREITIQHADGLHTRYLHVDSVYVQKGQIVQQGQKIGHTSYVLHFEVLKNRQPVDPENYVQLEKNIVRSVIK